MGNYMLKSIRKDNHFSSKGDNYFGKCINFAQSVITPTPY